MRTKSFKSEVIRFFINRYTRNLSAIFLLLPWLFLCMKLEKSWYSIVFYAISLAVLTILVNGKNIKGDGNKTYRKRYKYRYIFFTCYLFFSVLLCCLMDNYFYGSDYLTPMMEVTSFYILFSVPFITIRTHYSRALDLLDYHCDEISSGVFLVAVIISFYLIMFGFMYVVNSIGAGHIFWSGEDNFSGMILITMIEYFLYIIIFWLYAHKRGKDKNPIWY